MQNTLFPDGFFEETKRLYLISDLLKEQELNKHLKSIIRGFKSQRTIRKKKWKH